MRASVRTYAGLSLVTLATLMLQILLTRIFSVTLWYHFAFMAVSIAMFGMTVGAILVYLRPQRFTPEHAKDQIASYSLRFAVAVPVCFVLHLLIPHIIGTGSISWTGSMVSKGSVAGGSWLATFLYLGVTYVVISVPFVFSGVVVCLALTRFPGQVGRLYAADLIGAAAGCVLLIGVLRVTDGPTAVLVVSALAAGAALLFAADATGRTGFGRALAACVVLSTVALGHTLLVWQERPLLRLTFAKGETFPRPLFEKWNPYAYFKIEELHGVPRGWGLSTTFERDYEIEQLGVSIDSWAATIITRFDGNLAPLKHLKYDVTNLAHYLRSETDVFVIGVGGGRDILAALAFGQRSVTGVEINDDLVAAVNDRFGDFSGHLDHQPGVHFVNDEARSWITRQDRRWGILQVSLIDTFAATAAGAFALTENSLYTVEAWKLFLEHLDAGGLLTFARWHIPARPAELYRLTALASAALLELGAEDPAAHIALVSSIPPGQRKTVGVGTLVVGRSPLSASDLETLRETAARLRFSVLLAPGVEPADGTLAAIASGKALSELAANYPLDISPPTDDRPFFFNMLRLRDVLEGRLAEGHINAFNMKAVTTLGALLAIVAVLTMLCIALPLLLTVRTVPRRGSAPFFVFFAAIGFGFMLVEISQLQRLIVFLGHPTYSLSVVLFSLLLASGIGSALTPSDVGRRRSAILRLLLLLGVLILFGLLTPPLADAFAGATTPVRIAVAIGILTPLGLFMGMAFPLGMSLASARHEPLTPWLWGLNGATSVCASVLAVVIALAAGISMAFWTGAACYAVALGAFATASRTR